jgi:hypothetical protein
LQFCVFQLFLRDVNAGLAAGRQGEFYMPEGGWRYLECRPLGRGADQPLRSGTRLAVVVQFDKESSRPHDDCGARSEPHQNAPSQEVRKDLLPNTTAAYSNEADAGDEPPP